MAPLVLVWILDDVLTALALGMLAESLAWALDRAAGITTPGYQRSSYRSRAQSPQIRAAAALAHSWS